MRYGRNSSASAGRSIVADAADAYILDLCGGTGAWSQPYRDAGYNTLVVDPKAIALPNGQTYLGTVKEFNAELEREMVKPRFHGVLVAPPCTEFASSGARWWKSKPPELLAEAIRVVNQCLWTTAAVEPKWWALENPVGRLTREIGPYVYTFQPWEYGDPWVKRSCIWGNHVRPTKRPVAILDKKSYGHRNRSILWKSGFSKMKPEDLREAARLGMLPPDWVHKLGPSPERATLRSITPPGFARAFFEANP
jgi:hypothetical protein